VRLEGRRSKWEANKRLARYREEGAELRIADLGPRRPQGWSRKKVMRSTSVIKVNFIGTFAYFCLHKLVI
jgi:hypothetical protein